MAKPGTLKTAGPAPKTLKAWCLAVARKGCRKFRVHVRGQKEPSMVAYSTAAASARTIEKMEATSCEALDDDGSILRIWQFQEKEDPEEVGYLKDPDDTEDERILKTFAHLIADAYRAGNKQLVEVIQIQGSTFSEERKQLTALRILNDKLLGSLARKARIRVATEEGEEEEGDGAEDNVLSELLQPMLQTLVQKAAKKAGADAAEVLGKEPKTSNGAKEE